MSIQPCIVCGAEIAESIKIWSARARGGILRLRHLGLTIREAALQAQLANEKRRKKTDRPLFYGWRSFLNNLHRITKLSNTTSARHPNATKG